MIHRARNPAISLLRSRSPNRPAHDRSVLAVAASRRTIQHADDEERGAVHDHEQGERSPPVALQHDRELVPGHALETRSRGARARAARVTTWRTGALQPSAMMLANNGKNSIVYRGSGF